ncbi:MAG: hypothetical protein KA715_13430 [Xanthomonadaceae bacterium]|nr:hypothetical protein [Xanthomonadaceae bacterium]
MKKQKKQRKLGMILVLTLMFTVLTGARTKSVETSTDAPFRIKKVYEPKKRSPASIEPSALPTAEPLKEPEKDQFPWLLRFSRKSTR